MALFWSFILTIIFFSFTTNAQNHKTSYIVQVDHTLKPYQYSNLEQWYRFILKDLNNSDFIHVYRTVFRGFAAKLTQEQVQALERHPGILKLFPERVYLTQTTRSPDFLGLRTSSGRNRLSSMSDDGANVIIGMIDTGIWPERESFHDKDLEAVPARWRGVCEGGADFPKTLCNNKIIGVRYYGPGVVSARDNIGHGTHTASTAAGQPINNASFLGYAEGVAEGMASKAKLAVYKVCDVQGCRSADILAAVDKAVEDGVDIISMSLGPTVADPLVDDVIAIGAFSAIDRGVFVSVSAGNSGPDYGSIVNPAPWIITVGAGTIDRRFLADLVLQVEGSLVLTGSSIYSGKPLPNNPIIPLVYGDDCDFGSFIGKSVRGKIVVCDCCNFPSQLQQSRVQNAGGVGIVITNGPLMGGALISEPMFMPGLFINESSRQILLDYINLASDPRATIIFCGTQLGFKPAPMVTSFSSRGPNTISNYIMKPDLIAPGADILAAWTSATPPSSLTNDQSHTDFNIISGTSMSCPHVSGIAALLRGTHSDWTHAMIKSALMTTAYTHDRDGNPILEDRYRNKTTVWDIGSGHVDPERAVNPGLVYDLTSVDYIHFLCASNYTDKDIKIITQRKVNCSKAKKTYPWDLNYPAISVVFNTSEPNWKDIVVTRTVTNVSNTTSIYRVKVNPPRGIRMEINPAELVFTSKGQKRSYVVRFTAADFPREESSSFGALTWEDGEHHVRSSIIVMWQM